MSDTNQESVSSPAVTGTTQESLKQIIAANIAELRRSRGMTQADLAMKLNYSDKAISKWERGESVPDITVLKAIADLFEVTVDYLLTPTHDDPAPTQSVTIAERNTRTRGFVTAIAVVLVWMVATVMFVLFNLLSIAWDSHWLIFVYALPVSLTLWLIFNAIWFDHKRNYPIISGMMWSTLFSLYVSVWRFDIEHVWMLFLLGVPGQTIIILWSRLKKRERPGDIQK